MFDPNYDPARNKSVMVLMRFFFLNLVYGAEAWSDNLGKNFWLIF